jgi:hypothetical protein
MTWDYEKLDENLKRQWLPINDFDGKITGKIVFGVKAWMDENPEERKARGWIKHIHFEKKEMDEKWPYNPRTQYRLQSLKRIDEWTVEDDYHIIDKSEEMMQLEELLGVVNAFGDDDSVITFGGVGL